MAKITFENIQKSFVLEKHEFKKKLKKEIKKLKNDIKTSATEELTIQYRKELVQKEASIKNIQESDLNVQIIKDFNLTIEDKEFVVFVGPSGCGKSTVLRMLAGLESTTEGSISIGDKLVNNVSPKDRDIAFVFQSYALYPHLNIFDNIAFGLKIRKMPEDEIQTAVMQAAKTLQLTEQLYKKPKQLSGGQRQRVAMGRAIVRKPSAFLFDEPLSNLDAKLRQEMRFQIKKITQKFDTTTVYVTHDQVEAMTLADKIVVLNRLEEGVEQNIQQVGPPLEIYYNPYNVFVAEFIGTPTINIIEGEIKKNGADVFFISKNLNFRVDNENKKFIEKNNKDKVILGIRPLDIGSSGQDSAQNKLTGICEITENLGAEIQAVINCDSIMINSVMSSRKKIKMGDSITLDVNLDNAHFFDIDSKINLNRI